MYAYFSIGKEPSWLDCINHAYCAYYNSYVCIQVRGHHPCPSNDIRDQIDVAREWDVERGPETEMQQIVACVHGFPQRWYHDMPAGACAVPLVYILFI